MQLWCQPTQKRQVSFKGSEFFQTFPDLPRWLHLSMEKNVGPVYWDLPKTPRRMWPNHTKDQCKVRNLGTELGCNSKQNCVKNEDSTPAMNDSVCFVQQRRNETWNRLFFSKNRSIYLSSSLFHEEFFRGTSLLMVSLQGYISTTTPNIPENWWLEDDRLSFWDFKRYKVGPCWV